MPRPSTSRLLTLGWWLQCASKGSRCLATVAKSGKDLATVDATREVTVPPQDLEAQTVTVAPGQAHLGDLRSASGLGLGDGLLTHSSKWLQTDGYVSGNTKSPMQFIQEAPPIKVHGAVVASFGSDDPSLGCPVEYIDLRGTSIDNPAVCKYTGNKYYSDPGDWLAH